jgi:hypothetical protein
MNQNRKVIAHSFDTSRQLSLQHFYLLLKSTLKLFENGEKDVNYFVTALACLLFKCSFLLPERWEKSNVAVSVNSTPNSKSFIHIKS